MKGPISQFITHHYRHFNAAALVDAAKGYETHLLEGGKMMVTLAGAMSTAELGISLAEMIRQDKIQIISCTGANLEEDVMNLVAHKSYKRVPNYRDLTPQDEWDLLENHYNRVTDTCIPEEEAFRRLQKHLVAVWQQAEAKGERYFPHEFLYQVVNSGGMRRDFPGAYTVSYQAGGATLRPRTLCSAMKRATSPEAFAFSTKSARKAAAAVLRRDVPMACCTAVNLPSRIRAPGIFSISESSLGRSPASTSSPSAAN